VAIAWVFWSRSGTAIKARDDRVTERKVAMVLVTRRGCSSSYKGSAASITYAGVRTQVAEKVEGV
jgi:hypothetical protein